MAKEFVNIRKRRKSTSDDCVPIECNITKKSGIDSNEYLYTGEHHASNVKIFFEYFKSYFYKILNRNSIIQKLK